MVYLLTQIKTVSLVNSLNQSVLSNNYLKNVFHYLRGNSLSRKELKIHRQLLSLFADSIDKRITKSLKLPYYARLFESPEL